jgi:ABC-2 type transport system permease protein
MALVVWIWVPCLMAVSVVADAFAGERERHTLETLLSMPLADGAIFIGKFAAAVLYGWAFTVVASLVAAGAVNVLHLDEAPIFYTPGLFAGVLVIGLLVTALLVSTGILVSLRSPTVRQATQTVSILVLALVLIPAGLSQLAPAEWMQAILDGVDRVGPVAAGIVVAALLAAIDATIVIAGMGRFKRAHLAALS